MVCRIAPRSASVSDCVQGITVPANKHEYKQPPRAIML